MNLHCCVVRTTSFKVFSVLIFDIIISDFLYNIVHPKLFVVVVVGVVDIISLACKCKVHFLVCTTRPTAVPVLLSGCRHHCCLDSNICWYFCCVSQILQSQSLKVVVFTIFSSFHDFMRHCCSVLDPCRQTFRAGSMRISCGFYFWCFLSPSAELLSPFTSHKVFFQSEVLSRP